MVEKEGIAISYSDGRFYRDVLHGLAYRYWWESLARTGIWATGLAWPGVLNLRG
ncbi:MAG TPA: hypothetical protein PLZ65_06915 [Limnochordia bacterium]|nr:hypothetical protein [Limnochordia bacterium]